jgi:hypothetical protein
MGAAAQWCTGSGNRAQTPDYLAQVFACGRAGHALVRPDGKDRVLVLAAARHRDCVDDPARRVALVVRVYGGLGRHLDSRYPADPELPRVAQRQRGLAAAVVFLAADGPLTGGIRGHCAEGIGVVIPGEAHRGPRQCLPGRAEALQKLRA